MSWINKILPSIRSTSSTTGVPGKQRASVPEGLWKKCPRCEAVLYRPDLERNLEVCPKCDHHLRITARRRLELFLDPAGQVELNADMEPVDILKFRDLKKYKDRLLAAQKATGERDALIVVQGTVNSVEMVVAAFEFAFIGGSMGAVVGEKFTQAVNTCIEKPLPLWLAFANKGCPISPCWLTLCTVVYRRVSQCWETSMSLSPTPWWDSQVQTSFARLCV